MTDVVIPETLSFDEVTEYEMLELKIEAGLKTFYEVGDALLAIRDGKLYREEYGTFEDYCQQKWQIPRRQAYRLMESAEVVHRIENENVSHGTQTPLPANERQARALTSFDPEIQPAIVRLANGYAKSTGKPVTAGMLERVGSVLEEAELTGHVDTGSGESSALFAAIAATEYEATARQKQYQKQHYETHDAQGKVKPEEKERRRHLNVLLNESVEWYTPPIYIEAACEVMGGFDIDPASNDTAQKVIQAAVYYTAETNGLDKEWSGRLWLNPPWGDLCRKFVRKAVAEFEAGNVTEAILLLNSNSNETEWFAPLWNHTLCFTKGRINFYAPTGEASGSTHGSCFIYMGENVEKFAEVFKQFGPVVRRVA